MTVTASGGADRRNERALWLEAVRDVAPLRDRARPGPIPARPVAPPEKPSVAPPLPAASAGPGFARLADLDRATAERLKRGRRAVEAQLDLHGLTQPEAHRRLTEFVESCYRDGRRCLLIVTGRGLGPDGPGVLKASVPRWLTETSLRQRVLAVATAQPRHGRAGALYVLLRRRR